MGSDGCVWSADDSDGSSGTRRNVSSSAVAGQEEIVSDVSAALPTYGAREHDASRLKPKGGFT